MTEFSRNELKSCEMASLIVLSLAFLLGGFILLDCDPYLYFSSFNKSESFQVKVVWIVGASSGIGASLAIDMAKAGAKLILSARRIDRLNEVGLNCSSHHGITPMILPFDILDHTNHENIYRQIIKDHGKVDVLVLNSGRSQRSLAIETPISTAREMFELNFFSFVSLTGHVLPAMVEARNGHVRLLFIL